MYFFHNAQEVSPPNEADTFFTISFQQQPARIKKKQRTVGFAFTGSFCTYEKIKEVVRQLVKEDNRVIPIFSQTAQTVNCRFGDARDFIIEIQEITGERGIFSIQEAEPIGPKGLLDILVIAPCTGNTMAKLAAGITDTPVLMAAKAHMRNDWAG